MKKTISVLLVLALLCCLVPAAFAAESSETAAAEKLYDTGLFSGTGTDAQGNPVFSLDKVPTRSEAVTMLVNLLGKSDVAKAGTWTTPFTDVPEWAQPYVGYAFANGLTSGTGKTAFGSALPVSADQYLTLVLRALGYKDGTDFSWKDASAFAQKLGLTGKDYSSVSKFLRGDIAKISEAALAIDYKNTDVALSQIIELAKGLAAESDTDIPVDQIAAIIEKVTASNGKLSSEDISAIAKAVAAEYDTGLPVEAIADIAVTIADSKGSDIPVEDITSVAKTVVAKYDTDSSIPVDDIAGIATMIYGLVKK